MTTPAPLRIERDGDVAVVVLENPPLNLFDGPAFDALEAVAADLVPLTDPARVDRVRAVLFEARGKVVSGGVDVTEFRDIAEGPEPARRGGELWARLLKVSQTIEDLPVPTVFAAHGLTLTAAFELALACDLRVAAPGIRLGLPEAGIGMGANFGSVVLPKRIPMGIAMEMLLTGDYVTSEDAERWGLVNRLTDDVLPTAMALAEKIAANAPISVRRMKETAVKGLELPLWQALRLDVGPNPYLSEDRREGIAAYLEKRPPRWTGR